MEELQINWRERTGHIRIGDRGDLGVRSALSRFGVLKFVENPLLTAGDPLLA